MKTAKWVIGGALIGSLLAACGSSTDTQEETGGNSKEVTVNDYVYYDVGGSYVYAFCDGTTRVYVKSEAVSAIANSKECGAQ